MKPLRRKNLLIEVPNLLDNCYKGTDGNYNYLYCIINRRLDKVYIGISYNPVHPKIRDYNCSCEMENFWEDLLDHHEFFEKRILEWFDTKEQTLKREGELVTWKEVRNPNYYNGYVGGCLGGLTPKAQKTIEEKYGKLGLQFNVPHSITARDRTNKANKTGAWDPKQREYAQWCNGSWRHMYSLSGDHLISLKGELGITDFGFEISMCKRNKHPNYIFIDEDSNKTFDDILEEKLRNSYLIEKDNNGNLLATFWSKKSVRALTGMSYQDYMASKPFSKFQERSTTSP